MTVREALELMRHRVNDTMEKVYPDEELMGYLNLGIQAVALDLIRKTSPWMVKSFPIFSGTEGSELPVDFHSLLPGQPVLLSSGRAHMSAGLLSRYYDVRYFFVPAAVGEDGNVPFPSPHCFSAVNGAVELALMRTGHDVTPERAFHLLMEGKGNGLSS